MLLSVVRFIYLQMFAYFVGLSFFPKEYFEAYGAADPVWHTPAAYILANWWGAAMLGLALVMVAVAQSGPVACKKALQYYMVFGWYTCYLVYSMPRSLIGQNGMFMVLVPTGLNILLCIIACYAIGIPKSAKKSA
eukprot:gb/GEZN01020201.1/.p1 GENE.gb/GEZN01020201.1/~~gb/GEZN01020201.1/.p1  ORF type:complete len:135 (-),score=19.02 gb/GEZN01020201.1/:208-612(-)